MGEGGQNSMDDQEESKGEKSDEAGKAEAPLLTSRNKQSTTYPKVGGVQFKPPAFLNTRDG